MSLPRFTVTDAWKAAFPGATVAYFIAERTANPSESPALDEAKRSLETAMRERWAGKTRADLRAEPTLAVYHDYYKRFGQNYHVQMQIESIALKGKAIPGRAALVEAMFMSELATGILTAVHDADQLVGDVTAIATVGVEPYVRYDGVEEYCKPGDMAIRDEHSILSSVVQGPTNHARATESTTTAAFHLYAPAGIPEQVVRQHLELLGGYVLLITPDAVIHPPVIVSSPAN